MVKKYVFEVWANQHKPIVVHASSPDFAKVKAGEVLQRRLKKGAYSGSAHRIELVFEADPVEPHRMAALEAVRAGAVRWGPEDKWQIDPGLLTRPINEKSLNLLREDRLLRKPKTSNGLVKLSSEGNFLLDRVRKDVLG